VEVPDIQYTCSGDVAIAYQVVGDGPVDVVWFRGMAGDVAARERPGEVLVSSTVKDLVAGSEISFEDRGLRELKGVGEWRLYAVRD
jgi:hypothetical protein